MIELKSGGSIPEESKEQVERVVSETTAKPTAYQPEQPKLLSVARVMVKRMAPAEEKEGPVDTESALRILHHDKNHMLPPLKKQVA